MRRIGFLSRAAPVCCSLRSTSTSSTVTSQSSQKSLVQRTSYCANFEKQTNSASQSNKVFSYPFAQGGLFNSTPMALSPAITYRCKSCAKDFRLLAAMNHHIKTKHAGQAEYQELHDGIPAEGEASSGAPPAGGQRGQAAPEAAAAPPAAEPEAPPLQVFECTICKKQFRAEEALKNHYRIRHSGQTTQKPAPAQQPKPTAPSPMAEEATAASTTSESEAEVVAEVATQQQEVVEPSGPSAAEIAKEKEVAAAAAAVAKKAEGAASIASKMMEPLDPQPPQFHIDVAPNAPEENEIAAHSFCVNQMTVIGKVSDISTGFVFEEPCAQFTVTTEFESNSAASSSSDAVEKDTHTVRCFGADMVERIQALVAGKELGDGCTVLVSGRLRLVPQYAQATAKYYHFPVLYVNSGSSHIAVLENAAEGASATAGR